MVASNKLNLLTEDALSLPQAARELPGRPDASTLWRWSKAGLRGVRLETFKIGSRLFTTRQAVTRFVAATQEPAAV